MNKCFNCSRKVEKNFVFCPYCGKNLKREEDRRNFGFLGRDDEVESLGLSPFNGLFNNFLSELSRQLNDSGGDENNLFRRGIKVNVHSLNGKPMIKVAGVDHEEAKIKNNLSEEDIVKMKNLPKKEAEASVRRLSNKIIYEIELPGVKSIKNVLINKLESGIEIRAFSDNISYFKVLPINFPIIHYVFNKDKLVIEMNPRA